MKKLHEIGNQILKEEMRNKMNNHYRMTQLFSNTSDIKEDDQNYDRNDVIDKIKNNKWESPNAHRFKASIEKSHYPEFLTKYNANELSKMDLFKLEGYNIGYALKNINNGKKEIVSVYNNEPQIKNIGQELIMSAVKNGGCYIDFYDGFLTNLYKSMGFVEIKREKFNPDYDSNGEFRNKYGEPDVVYAVHNSCNDPK